jgi:hypothetical protein
LLGGWTLAGTRLQRRTNWIFVVRGMPWLISGRPEGVTIGGVKRREFPKATRSTLYLQQPMDRAAAFR